MQARARSIWKKCFLQGISTGTAGIETIPGQFMYANDMRSAICTFIVRMCLNAAGAWQAVTKACHTHRKKHTTVK